MIERKRVSCWMAYKEARGVSMYCKSAKLSIIRRFVVLTDKVGDLRRKVTSR